RGRLGRTWRLINELRAERLDVLLLLRASLQAGLVARFSGARYTIGYARRGVQWLLKKPTLPLHHGRGSVSVSAVDDYLNLLGVRGLRADSRHVELATTPRDEAAADGVWQRLALPPGERIMLLNAGGAYGEAKHWPAEYCVSLALRAAEEFDLTT